MFTKDEGIRILTNSEGACFEAGYDVRQGNFLVAFLFGQGQTVNVGQGVVVDEELSMSWVRCGVRGGFSIRICW